MRIELLHPDALWLLTALPLWALLVWPRHGRGVLYQRGTTPSTGRRWPGVQESFVLLAPKAVRALVFAALVLALAGPERIETEVETLMEGHGIGLVVDLSSSMLAEDMGDRQSRIAVARDAAVRFAARRPFDELSLVAFGSDALTRVPPTRDAALIAQGVESLEVQLVNDGTDMSGAVLTVIARLLASPREPRVIVLLTDGAHNGAELPPLVTARAAAALGVRIHAISILSPNDASLSASLLRRRFGEQRETVLRGLAGITGGRYFPASSPAALDSIYGEIDRLETPVARPVDREVRYPMRAWIFLLALALLGGELLLRGSRWGLVH